MRVYITRYALTRGIIELELEEESVSGKGCSARSDLNSNFFYGKEWHRTLEEAKKDAESRRDRKIESLKKQLAKLEEMKF